MKLLSLSSVLGALALATSNTEAMTFSEISRRQQAVRIPDTSEYNMVTTMESGSRRMSTSAHVIRCGDSLQWMEMQTDGRKWRVVRNRGRTWLKDLQSGSIHTQGATGIGLGETMPGRFDSSEWANPVQMPSGNWSLERLQPKGDLVREFLEVSDSDASIVGISRIGKAGDTTEIRLQRGVSDGRSVPILTQVRTRTPQGSASIGIEYSKWTFPNSLPESLFASP